VSKRKGKKARGGDGRDEREREEKQATRGGEER
jgi:hypothetical protein